MIKFRVRDPETKEIVAYEWVEDNEWRFRQTHWADKDDYCSRVTGYKGIREQFTGELDDNGDEIYKGDVCLARSHEDYINGKQSPVEFYHGSFVLSDLDINGMDLADFTNKDYNRGHMGVSVIGSIHDTPAPSREKEK